MTRHFSLALLVVLLASAAVSAAEPQIKLPAKEKFHLYLLIGQSNMAGRGAIEEQDKAAHERVLKFTKENTWAPASDPLHFDKPIAGVGLGSTFGRVMADADASVTIGLIPCAVGGTPLSRWQKGGDLYDQAVQRTKAALQDGTLRGILWHQGENDAGAEETAKSYGERLAGMVRDLRTELAPSDVPSVAGELGEFLRRESKDGKPNFWPLVNEQLATLPGSVAGTAVVSSSGLKHKGDEVHFDSASLRELGRRYAKAMQQLQATKASGGREPSGDAAPQQSVPQRVEEKQPDREADASRSPKAKPNIVIILADDLGFSDLGCYGGEIATPNLDALAQGGLRFTQFYNTARCWPTRGAMLTGYYAQQIRRDTVPGLASGGRGSRPAWARLLPEMLKPLGYRSYHSGKWHIDGKPLAGGFDRSYDLTDQGRFFGPKSHTEDDKPLPAAKPGYYATTAIADHALECLKDHAASHADRPLFSFIAFTAPHFPLHALDEDIARYRDKYRAGWDVVRQERWQRIQSLKLVSGRLSEVERDVGPPYDFPEALEKLGPGEVNRPLPWSELTDQQAQFQATKMAIHAALVDRMDREIGRILDQLRSMNRLDNTLLFFLSDNGASAEIMVRNDGHDTSATPGSAATHLCLGPGWSSVANTPFRRHKTWVHEGGICTPLVVHWPQGIAARGELRHNPGHVIDLVPTILEVAGGSPPKTWDGQPVPPAPGKSLVPAMAKDGSVQHEYLWWSHENNRALRVGDWKLVKAATDPGWQLFDLSSDRTESADLAAKMPEMTQKLEAQWLQLQDEFFALAKRDK